MEYQAAVITVSDGCSAGTRTDTSGPAVRAMLEEKLSQWSAGSEGMMLKYDRDRYLFVFEEKSFSDLVLTTGGTGLSPRDVTPEATRAVVHREIPAIPQTMLYASLAITPRAMLSRAAAGTRGSCLIINLPGSEKAARENLAAVLDTLGHALEMLRGGGH